MTKTNRIAFAAGLLAAFTALVHLIAGTAEIHQPLTSSSLPASISLLLLACWHLVSVLLVVSAVALLWCARRGTDNSSRALLLFVAATWLLSGLVFVVIALVYQGVAGLLMFPQWTLLLPIGLLSGWASQRTSDGGS